MSLDFLPKEIEDIINENTKQVEHMERFKKYSEELKKVERAEYTYHLNENVWELWCFKGYNVVVLEEHIFGGFEYEVLEEETNDYYEDYDY